MSLSSPWSKQLVCSVGSGCFCRAQGILDPIHSSIPSWHIITISFPTNLWAAHGKLPLIMCQTSTTTFCSHSEMHMQYCQWGSCTIIPLTSLFLTLNKLVQQLSCLNSAAWESSLHFCSFSAHHISWCFQLHNICFPVTSWPLILISSLMFILLHATIKISLSLIWSPAFSQVTQWPLYSSGASWTHVCSNKSVLPVIPIMQREKAGNILRAICSCSHSDSNGA